MHKSIARQTEFIFDCAELQQLTKTKPVYIYINSDGHFPILRSRLKQKKKKWETAITTTCTALKNAEKEKTYSKQRAKVLSWLKRKIFLLNITAVFFSFFQKLVIYGLVCRKQNRRDLLPLQVSEFTYIGVADIKPIFDLFKGSSWSLNQR